jgi:hypothetical protein
VQELLSAVFMMMMMMMMMIGYIHAYGGRRDYGR